MNQNFINIPAEEEFVDGKCSVACTVNGTETIATVTICSEGVTIPIPATKVSDGRIVPLEPQVAVMPTVFNVVTADGDYAICVGHFGAKVQLDLIKKITIPKVTIPEVAIPKIEVPKIAIPNISVNISIPQQ